MAVDRESPNPTAADDDDDGVDESKQTVNKHSTGNEEAKEKKKMGKTPAGGAERINNGGVACAICLAKDEKPVRGVVDGCGHGFCFVCIMEWARVESCCPLCNSPIPSVRRLPKPGVSDCERVVLVPVRHQTADQRRAETNCSECQSSREENYILICDLCGLAVHTYCVGLGRTVPEGDWYCHDCYLSRNDYLNCRLVNGDACKIHLAENSPAAEPSNQASFNGESTSSNVIRRRGGSHLCRNLHECMSTFTESWKALRRGEAILRSSMHANVSVSCSRKRSGSLSEKPSNVESKDVRRAWKMLKIAQEFEIPPSEIAEEKSKLGEMKKRLLQNIYPVARAAGQRLYKNNVSDVAQSSREQSSNCQEQSTDLQSEIEGPCIDSLREDVDAKSEIQSLVKLNLKPLFRNQQLDVYKFREVARYSTHTILAACGLQHSRSCVRQCVRSIKCRHAGQSQSSLMPGSCRECFSMYVKEVVSSTLCEGFN